MKVKPQSITRAYRLDLAERDLPFGGADDAWLAIGSLLEHAAAVADQDAAAAASLTDKACALSAALVSAERVETLRAREWEHRESSPLDALMLISDDAHDAGAPHIAASVLDGMLACGSSMHALTRGRIMARRTRVAWRLGWLSEAHDRASDLLAFGENEREPELVGRAWISFSALAQMRGNYPEMERAARETERLANELSSRYLLRVANGALMVVAGVRKDFDRALQYAWMVYQDSVDIPFEEAGILQNFGQIYLEAGYPDAARAAFSRVISQRLPARILLPALGGVALASAQTGRRSTVLWATAQTSGFDVAVTPKYPLAYALVECAAACEAIGCLQEADAARARAAELADTFKFHEIAFRAGERTASPAELGAPSQALTAKVVALEPQHLPECVELVGVE